MSFDVLLKLLNELWKQDKMRGLSSILSLFRNGFNQFNYTGTRMLNEPVHEISNNVVSATSKASDQPAHMCSLIRAFASCLSIL